VFSCDYNGWVDVPEEEREGIDMFEATQLPSSASGPASLFKQPMALILAPAHSPAGRNIHRRAA
jgi:hypothetical protein